MSTFPYNLKAARKMRGLSLQQLADAMGNITKQALNKYEAGMMEPGEEVMISLSTALDLPVDFFYRENSVALEKVDFRKQTRLGKKKEEAIKESTLDFVRRYMELESLLGVEEKVSWKKDFMFQVKSEEDVEKAADNVRKQWKLGCDPLYNVIELLEDHQVKIFELEEDPSFSGMSTWVNEAIPVIVVNTHPDIPIERKRFTVLHELGHLVMQFGKIGDKQVESYCHQFAGAFLLPKETLLKEIGAEKRDRIFFQELVPLKEQYGISIAAILFRLLVNGIISKNYHKWAMINYNRFGYRSAEPGKYKGEERSLRFRQLLLRGVAMELISTTKAASLNNQKLSEFRKLLM